MSTAIATAAPDPGDGRNDRNAKRTTRKPDERARHRDVAPKRPGNRLILLFQYRLLDWILEHGEAFVPTVADGFKTPPRVTRYFIGGAVQSLAKTRMIAPTGERRAATTGGRHACIVEVWRLAPGVDRNTVAEWKRLRPIPPEAPEAVVEP